MVKEMDFLLVFETDSGIAEEFLESTKDFQGNGFQGDEKTRLARIKEISSSAGWKAGMERYNDFIRLLEKKYGSNLRLQEERQPGAYRDVSVLLPVPWNPPERLYHSLDLQGTFIKAKGQYYHVFVCRNDTIGVDYPEYTDFFHDLFLSACIELKPVFGSANETGLKPEERPCFDQAEYYQNPYFFCVEPSFGPAYAYEEYNLSFLNDSQLASKISQIEKIVARDELVEILRKHSEKVVVGDDGGVGVVKGVLQAVYPRYFIRQELRRRGIQLPEGLAEKYAGSMGLKKNN